MKRNLNILLLLAIAGFGLTMESSKKIDWAQVKQEYNAGKAKEKADKRFSLNKMYNTPLDHAALLVFLDARIQEQLSNGQQPSLNQVTQPLNQVTQPLNQVTQPLNQVTQVTKQEQQPYLQRSVEQIIASNEVHPMNYWTGLLNEYNGLEKAKDKATWRKNHPELPQDQGNLIDVLTAKSNSEQREQEQKMSNQQIQQQVMKADDTQQNKQSTFSQLNQQAPIKVSQTLVQPATTSVQNNVTLQAYDDLKKKLDLAEQERANLTKKVQELTVAASKIDEVVKNSQAIFDQTLASKAEKSQNNLLVAGIAAQFILNKNLFAEFAQFFKTPVIAVDNNDLPGFGVLLTKFSNEKDIAALEKADKLVKRAVDVWASLVASKIDPQEATKLVKNVLTVDPASLDQTKAATLANFLIAQGKPDGEAGDLVFSISDEIDAQGASSNPFIEKFVSLINQEQKDLIVALANS